jgi:hypothetical protein
MDLGPGLCYAAPMPQTRSDHFFLQTLGCKVNQYESRALTEAWGRAGLIPAETPEAAGLVVLCTCTVTARAAAESRRLARKLVREAAPGAIVVVTGCAAAVAPESFAALGAVPAPDKAALARSPLEPPRAPAGPAYPDLALSGYDRARDLLKIQDGCSTAAVLIVPLAGRVPVTTGWRHPGRGERLIAARTRELGLTGINLGHFGRD